MRARFASERGLGLSVRLTARSGLQGAIAQMLDFGSRAAFAAAGRSYGAPNMVENGAMMAATAVAALCQMSQSRGPAIRSDDPGLKSET